MDWWVYIVDKSGKLYVGITTDIDNRLRQHGNTPLLHREKKQSLCEKMPEKQM